jgi:hypothetical protein
VATDIHRLQGVVGWERGFNAAPPCHKQTAREATGNGDSRSPPPLPLPSPPTLVLTVGLVCGL